MLEFTVVAATMMAVLFGVIEFAHLFSQWNAATKAVQVGARLAATSAPIWDQLDLYDGQESGGTPGDPVASNYRVRCVGTGEDTGTCTLVAGSDPGGGGGGGNNGGGFGYDDNAMDILVYGRDAGQNIEQCRDGPGTYPGMCDIFTRVRPQNVVVTYEHTGMGFVSRPGGLVPTITVELTGLNFDFIFLDDLMRVFPGNPVGDTIPIPGLRSTVAAEDMRPGAPTF